MRCILTFELPEAVFPSDSTRLLISFFKKSIEAYDIELFEKLFGKGQTKMKSYAYDVYLPIKGYEKGSFLLKQPFFKITFSSCSLEEFGLFFGAFANQKYQPYHWQGTYQFTLKELKVLKSREIEDEQLMIDFISPLLVLDYDLETGYKHCFTPENVEFESALRRVLQCQIDTLAPHLTLDGFQLIPIKTKQVMAQSYGLNLRSTRGLFYLSGSKELLQLLYDAGIGNSRGAGFGLFNIIQ